MPVYYISITFYLQFNEEFVVFLTHEKVVMLHDEGLLCLKLLTKKTYLSVTLFKWGSARSRITVFFLRTFMARLLKKRYVVEVRSKLHARTRVLKATYCVIINDYQLAKAWCSWLSSTQRLIRTSFRQLAKSDHKGKESFTPPSSVQ